MKAQHNDVYVSHHKVDGWSERKAYVFKEYVNGPKWIPFTTDYGDYLCGYLPPRYPVPALADTATVMCLTLGAHCIWEHDIAWDDIWQENIPDYVPFICPL